jgi:hypothetical protein
MASDTGARLQKKIAQAEKLRKEIRDIQTRMNSKNRKAETRKKIIWGSRPYEAYKNGTLPQEIYAWLTAELSDKDLKFLTEKNEAVEAG